MDISQPLPPFSRQSVGRGEIMENVVPNLSAIPVGNGLSKLTSEKFPLQQAMLNNAAICKRSRVSSGDEMKMNRKTNSYFAPPGVARRNARERNRVKQVNNGFAALRQHLPIAATNKKMSKVETLRTAVAYIRNLKELLDGGEHVTRSLEASSFYSGLNFPQQSGNNVAILRPQNSALFSNIPSNLLSPCSSDATSSPSSCSETSPTYERPLKCDSNLSAEDEDFLEAMSWWQNTS